MFKNDSQNSSSISGTFEVDVIETVSWNPDDEMSKEFALNLLNEIKCFYRRLYYFPDMKPFVTEAGFNCSQSAIDGLKEFIEKNIKY